MTEDPAKWIHLDPTEPSPEEVESPEIDEGLHRANELAHRVARLSVDVRRLWDVTNRRGVGFGALRDAGRDLNLAVDEYEKLCQSTDQTRPDSDES